MKTDNLGTQQVTVMTTPQACKGNVLLTFRHNVHRNISKCRLIATFSSVCTNSGQIFSLKSDTVL